MIKDRQRGRRASARVVGVLLAVAAALVCATPVLGASGTETTHVWVAPGGDDRAAGTKAEPLGTLARAQSVVRRLVASSPSGDVVVNLKPGTYRLGQPLVLTGADSPASGGSVTWRSAPGGTAVISGALDVPGAAWSRFDAKRNIWRAKVGRIETRDLVVNGTPATRAKTSANPPGFRPQWRGGGPESGIAYVPTIQPGGLNPARWGDPSTWQNVGDIEAVVVTQWKMMRVPVRSVSPPPAAGSPGLIQMSSPAWQNANAFVDAKTGAPNEWSFWRVSWFENALRFLDSPGEWYLDEDAGWLYYSPRPGENLRTAQVELPVLQTLVKGAGTASDPVRNITFSGLTLQDATWLRPSSRSGYVSDQGGFHLVGPGFAPTAIGHFPNASPTPGNVAFRYARDVTFLNNRFDDLGAVALALDKVKNVTVDGNLFTTTGSSAIRLGGIDPSDHHPTRPQETRGNTITDNQIVAVAQSYQDAPGIAVGFARDTTISRNVISNVPWSGIAVGWGWGLLDPGGFPGLPDATQGMWGDYTTPTSNRGSVISNNTISEFLQVLWDGGAVYTTGAQGSSSADALRIVGNTASAKRETAGGNTFYTDGGSRYVALASNTSRSNPIGVLDFGPRPVAEDPLPFAFLPTFLDGLPYGSDLGGCRTYGDISYVGNDWLQTPIPEQLPFYNGLYALAGLEPWSERGFFGPCPYTDPGGVSFPTGLSFQGNTAGASP